MEIWNDEKVKSLRVVELNKEALFKENKLALDTSRYSTGLVVAFNCARVASDSPNVVKMHYLYDINEQEALDASVLFLQGHVKDSYYLYSKKRDTEYDSVPDAETGIWLVFVKNGFKADHPLWYKILVNLGVASEF